MKKFDFKYKRLKKIRKVQEELANKDYQNALIESKKKASELDTMYEQINQTLELQRIQLEAKQINSAEFLMQQDFMTGQKVLVQNKTSDVRSAKQVVEEKLDQLFDAHKSRKQIDKLEEKKKSQYTEDYKYHQLKLLEDIVMTRIKKGE